MSQDVNGRTKYADHTIPEQIFMFQAMVNLTREGNDMSPMQVINEIVGQKNSENMLGQMWREMNDLDELDVIERYSSWYKKEFNILYPNGLKRERN